MDYYDYDWLDWMADHIGWVFLGLTGLAICAVVVGCSVEERSRKCFMEECSRYERKYRCVAMWRAGDRNTAAVPVVIPMPLAR